MYFVLYYKIVPESVGNSIALMGLTEPINFIGMGSSNSSIFGGCITKNSAETLKNEFYSVVNM